MIARTWSLLTIGLALCLGADLVAREPAKARLVKTVKGRVLLETCDTGKPAQQPMGLADVLVTDGIQFVRTNSDGAYAITVADDPMIPYKPARVVSVCWPTGTWPVERRFYARLGDVQPGQSVDFVLRAQKQKLPLTFVHGTDPHNDLGGVNSQAFRDDIERMAENVNFCVFTGDLGYASRNSEPSFASINKFTRAFPVPMLHTPGNHDIADIHTKRWSEQDERAGYGLYTRFLGPIRWSFDYAGVHFVGLDWARITDDGILETGVPDVAIDWLKKDLAQRLPGTRTLLFMHHHFRHGDDKFWDLLVEHKVELVVAGHSHRNLDQSRRGVEAFTTMNLAGAYRLVIVHEKGHDYVHRCFGCKTAPSHSKHCKLLMPADAMKARRGLQKEVNALELKSAAQTIEGMEAKRLEIIADLEPGTARKFGLRLVPNDPRADVVEIACAGDEIQSGAIRSTAVRARGQKSYHLHVLMEDGMVRVFANNRARFERPIAAQQSCRVVLFAADGRAVVQKVQAWELKEPANARPMP